MAELLITLSLLSKCKGEMIYPYAGTNAFKIRKTDYKYWNFGPDPH